MAKRPGLVNVQLPLFVTPKNKLQVTIIVIIIGTLLYSSSNHLLLFETQLLNMTEFDQNVPFLPWTFWIYISEYLFFYAVYQLVTQPNLWSKCLYAAFTLQVTSIIIFFLWPTIYPRELFPIPESTSSITRWTFTEFRKLDAPTNCAPSLHVSTCYLLSFIFLNEARWKFIFIFIWASAVAVTTMTTKQHYLIDVIWGFGMAVLVYVVFFKLFAYVRKAR